MAEEEVWRPIPGFEGLYSASSLGRIRRHNKDPRATPHHTMRLSLKRGRYGVGLFKDGTKHHFWVHKLVALAFIGPAPVGYEVDHKDGVRSNDRVDNLEYVTKAENGERATKMGLHPRGARNGRARLTPTQAQAIREDRSSTIDALAASYGVHRNTIKLVRSGKTWAA